MNSLIINLKKGTATEKIKLYFKTRLHNNSIIEDAIVKAHKKIKPVLGKQKLFRLPSMRAGAVRAFGGMDWHRAKDLKRVLGTKERVYRYLNEVISSDLLLLKSEKYPPFDRIDIDKMLRNHLGKF